MNFELSAVKASHSQSRRPARSHSVPPATRLNVGNGNATRDLRTPVPVAESPDWACNSVILIQPASVPHHSSAGNKNRDALNAELLNSTEHASASELSALLGRGAEVDARDAFGRTALALATLHKNIPLALALIAAGANINARDDAGNTLALRACAPKCQAILQALIARGVDLEAVSARGVTPLMYSAANGCTESLSILLERKVALNTEDEGGYTALMWASSRGFLVAVNTLIQAGADVRHSNGYGLTALHVAAVSSAGGVLKALIRGGASVNAYAPAYGQTTPLALAAVMGNEAAIEVLIYEGADINCRDSTGATPLHLAILNGRTNAVKVLVERGRARVDLTAYGYGEATPLWLAASLGQLETLRHLIRVGAAVDVPNAEGLAPLHAAVEGAHALVVELLLVGGKADPNPRWVASRRTPAILAAMVGDTTSLQLLIAANARLDLKDAEGMTALDHASLGQHADAIALLASARKRRLNG